MAMVVKNNMSAMNTLNTLNKNSSALSNSLQKVSSGMRINSAADDSSGYAISERMRVQIRSLDQDNKNTQNGNAMMKVAEGAVSSTVEILKTLKEKVINAANDTNTDADRATIQKELDQSIDQIDDNANITYNGKYLVDGSHNTIGKATYTALTNQSLAEDTTGKTKLVDLKSRTNESLNLDKTDKVTVSYVQGGKTYSATFSVGDKTLQDIFSEAEKIDGGSVLFAGADNESVIASSGKTVTKDEIDTLKTTMETKKTAYETACTTASVLDMDDAEAKLETARVNLTENKNTIADLQASLGTIKTNSGDVIAADTTDGLYKAAFDAAKAYNAAALADDASTDTKFTTGITTAANDGAAMLTALEGDAKYGDIINDSDHNGRAVEDAVNAAKQAQTKLTTEQGKTSDLDTAVATARTNRNNVKTAYDEYMSALADYNEVAGPAVLKGGNVGVDKAGKIVTTANGDNAVTITANAAGVDGQIAGLTISVSDAQGNIKKSANAVLDNFNESVRAENESKDNAIALQVGTKANQAIKVGLTDMRSEALGLKGKDGTKLNISTQTKANAAINVLDNAIQKALDQQTTIGSVESRLNYTSANLTTASENVQSSESTIRDADMAKEMTDYTRNNVLLQAAQSMLAQANQSSSSVLSLLQ